MDPDISIVIPVYNTSEYLKESIESVLSQDYKNIEVVIIDDGSDDGSERICDFYAASDGRVRVFHQDNKGLLKARKTGISESRGKYIIFVDSDDVADRNMVSALLETSAGADLTVGCAVQEIANGEHITLCNQFEDRLYKGENDIRFFLDNMICFNGENSEGVLPYAWAKLYRRNILSEIFENLDTRISYAEDRELVYHYILKCKSIRIYNRPVYQYRFRQGSILHKANDRVLLDMGYLYNSLKELFERHWNSKNLLRQLQRIIMTRMYLATCYMGFEPQAQTVRYIYPFYNMFQDCKLVLYGAGVVGNNYYQQTAETDEVNWVLWVDKNVHTNTVSDIEILKQAEFDYIIIAVKNEGSSLQIRSELGNMGIPDEKILWKKPITLAE